MFVFTSGCGDSPNDTPPYIDPNMAGMLWSSNKKERGGEVLILLFIVAKYQFNVYLIIQLIALPIELTLCILGCVGRSRGASTATYMHVNSSKPFSTLADIND